MFKSYAKVDKLSKRRAVYDCFTFFNELDILEIRLNILNDCVDWFVIAEATRTHSGMPKKLIFQENINRFSKFLNKIIYIEVDVYPEFKNSWTYENYQRNCISEKLIDCNDDDIIMISDVDEIPNPDVLNKLIDTNHYICLLQDMCFFYVNYLSKKHSVWRGGTKLFKYSFLKYNKFDERYISYNDTTFTYADNSGPTLTKARLYQNVKYVSNGGWHFSYLGGIKSILEKLKSFSHQELNNDFFANEERIIRCLESGEDFFQRPNHTFSIVDNDHRLPNYLISNKEKYNHLFAEKKIKINISSLEFNIFSESLLIKKTQYLKIILIKLNLFSYKKYL